MVAINYPQQPIHNHRIKADNISICSRYLNSREARLLLKGYQSPKWIVFCRSMLKQGFDVYLYEARKTFSKYITVKNKDREFKVRFSNHKPIKSRELKGDCDFFVGVTNLGWSTTEQAQEATIKYLKGIN